MIVCDYCGAELIEGKVCLKCSQSYCNKCASQQNCFICESELLNIRVDPQEHGGSVVQWISSGQGKQFGLATEFSEIPQIAFNLLRSPMPVSADYDVILFLQKHNPGAL